MTFQCASRRSVYYVSAAGELRLSLGFCGRHRAIDSRTRAHRPFLSPPFRRVRVAKAPTSLRLSSSIRRARAAQRLFLGF
ncbi:hypothetical protein chiPu_0015990 [Chiloscyllium punctatum]|uniref:Uncharacterized protein n=1 Tax=Chiloscyllium punctatum TaxID=137246 RepID=A0A401T486_CHIPU|nr:hypothetical protein [Chiloscyllium punctatum]